MRFLSIALACIFVSSLALANSIDSKVTDVTIYTDGATVTRSASISLNAGEQKVELSGFPSNLDARTMRLEVNRTSVRVGQVSVKKLNYRDAQDSEVSALEKKITAKRDQIRAVEDSTKSAKLQLKFLDSLASGYAKEAWVGSSQANADTASWQRALSVMQTGSTDAYKTVRSNILKIAELKKDLALLQKQLADKRSNKSAKSIIVAHFSTPAAVNAVVKVHYPRQRASWSPSYEARLNSDTGKLSLSQKAVISQSTEEAWNNVQVTLSSSQPSQDMQVAEQESLFYDLERQRRQAAPVAYAAKSVRAESDYVALEEVVVTGARRTERWTGNYSLNFPIAGRINVTNDTDENQAYDLENFAFDTKLITQIAPLDEDQAYLSARFKYEGSNPIYGSDMLVYVDGVLMGEADMPNIFPGKEVTLPMGVDRRVEVTVNNQGGQGGDGGIVRKQRTIARDLEIEISNTRSNIANIEVRAAYPVSKNKAVKIRIGDKATPPDDANDQGLKGVALWKKELQAGGTWKINYAYTLTHPADRELEQVYSEDY